MKCWSILIASLVSICLVLTRASSDYSGYSVLRVIPETSEQLSYLIRLDFDENDERIKIGGSRRTILVDYWRAPSILHVPVDVMTNERELLQGQFAARGMASTLLIENVQRFMDEKKEETRKDRSLWNNKAENEFTTNYHTNAEIIAYLSDLASRNTTPSVELDRIGITLEGRDIWNAKISSGGSSNKPAIYIECGMHAREWIGHATCIWIIDDLTSLYATDPEIRSLVDRFDWYITPVSNPDGYEFTWNSDRLWRKNRRPNAGSPCTGVDTNRNFDANFGGIGSSTDPCSDTYGGESAFSEVESQAMRDALLKIQDRVKAVVSIHNNAQMWISPYGFTLVRPADYAEMERIMIAGTDAIRASDGQDYIYGPGSEILYFTSGTTKDWVYDGLGVIHGYTLELRNTNDGFITPTSLIAPVATEAWNGLKAMANAIRV